MFADAVIDMRKTPLLVVLLFVTALAGGSAFAQRAQVPQRSRQRPNNQTARQPRISGNFAFQARSLPAEYSVLLTRTLFAKSHVSADTSVRSTANTNNGPRRVPDVVFRGAMREGLHYLAGIENTGMRGSTSTKWLSEGETVRPSGIEISQIALDHLIVVHRGSRKLVRIGQAIDAGEIIASPSTMPIIANAPRPTVE